MAKKAAAKRKPAAKSKTKKSATKAAGVKASAKKVDKTTVKLASNDAVKKFGDAYKRLKSDAQGVSGDMSALKTKVAEGHGHFKAIKIALDIASMSDAKIAVLLPHLDQALEVFEVYKRGNLQLEMFAANVLKDAQRAAEAAAKVKPAEPAKPPAKGDAKPSPESRIGRGKAAAANGGADGKIELSEVEAIKKKIEGKEFVSQAEREKLAEFEVKAAKPVEATAH